MEDGKAMLELNCCEDEVATVVLTKSITVDVLDADNEEDGGELITSVLVIDGVC